MGTTNKLDTVVIKPCPCGETPKTLCIEQGSSSKWGMVYGTCCSDWNVEFRTKYFDTDTDECMKQAIKQWNLAKRAL
ncbi:MAG: hypothetical protein GY821_12540 [Gammaproteobacteria bacterium]|nr:hypothetical protein [Gammaproteobacteria bacterium]